MGREKGKLGESQGRKATGLKPRGDDGRAARSGSKHSTPARQLPSRCFISATKPYGGVASPSEKGKPGENQGRKAKGLRAALPMIAWLPKKSLFFLLGQRPGQDFLLAGPRPGWQGGRLAPI